MKSEIKSEKGTEMKNDYRSKAMFGVELQKRAQKWYLENPHKNKDGYASSLDMFSFILQVIQYLYHLRDVFHTFIIVSDS